MALKANMFVFNENYCRQMDGMVICSRFASNFADMFMDEIDVSWSIEHGEKKLLKFVEAPNTFHNNIEFTMKLEKNGELEFSNVLVSRRSDAGKMSTHSNNER